MSLSLDHDPSMALDPLPQLKARFHVPNLADKPQNPIMEGLNFDRLESLHTMRHTLNSFPEELAIFITDLAVKKSIHNEESLWTDAAKHALMPISQIASWDELASMRRPQELHTPFLSEQSSSAFVSAQYHVLPTVKNFNYVEQKDLLQSLRLTALGSSSPLYNWTSLTETFVDTGGVILIDGKNEIVSNSFMKRFIIIGTVLRRLEILTEGVRSGPALASPTAHAFSHALAGVVAYLRVEIVKSSDFNAADHAYMLSAIELSYHVFEEAATALASLCHREVNLRPEDYPKPSVTADPISLLSRIYNHLQTHLERQSSHVVTASLGYILTTTSRHYITELSLSVGLGGSAFIGEGDDRLFQTWDLLDGYDQGEEELLASVGHTSREEFPTFVRQELADSLVIARKSLKILKAAKPDHPLLVQSAELAGRVEWFWTAGEIHAAWAGEILGVNAEVPHNTQVPKCKSITSNAYHPDLASQFSLFDLEPGISGHSLPLESDKSAQQLSAAPSLPVNDFISRFPSSSVSLHPLTPTLEHLTTLTFSPLMSHTLALSQALLDVFLPPLDTISTSNLDFREHVTLLRSYLLLTSHAFKSRLSAALFSDSGEHLPDKSEADQRARTNLLSRRPQNAEDNNGRQWAVGLASALTAQESWPPGGADLSFMLRTVIMDSLDAERNHHLDGDTAGDGGQSTASKGSLVVEEAEYRLGFAIRDMPAGTGRERWLNPASIEALDFLYIDYKAPQPLDVLITPEILSKYQRIFAFLLRLTRVEHISKAMYRMTRKASEPLFHTLALSNKLLLHFRFVSHSFVTSLMSYVFDTAIGGNFDAFLSRLSAGRSGDTKSEVDRGFSDVFELAGAHSIMLDSILSACLLRSGQRAVTDLLQGALELVLELGILVGELKRGRIEDHMAAPLLEDLYSRFRSKMSTLTKVLKALVDKGSTISRLNLEAAMRETSVNDSRRPPGGAESLYHLLLRLDLREWWSGTTRK